MNDDYRTSDLGLISTLKYFNKTAYALEKDTHNRTIFIYQDSPEIEEIATNYYKGGLLPVDPQKFYSSIKEIKTMIWQQYENTQFPEKRKV